MQELKTIFKKQEENNLCYNYKEKDLTKGDYNGWSNWATWNFWNYVSSQDMNNIDKQSVLNCLEEYRYLDFLNTLYPISSFEKQDFELFKNINNIDIVDIANAYFEMVE